MFDSFASEYPLHSIIYVNTEPSICIERIQKRSRTGETNIKLDYLINLDKYHKDMIYSENFCNNINIIDGNNDIYENPIILNKWIQKFDDIIKNL